MTSNPSYSSSVDDFPLHGYVQTTQQGNRKKPLPDASRSQAPRAQLQKQDGPRYEEVRTSRGGVKRKCSDSTHDSFSDSPETDKISLSDENRSYLDGESLTSSDCIDLLHDNMVKAPQISRTVEIEISFLSYVEFNSNSICVSDIDVVTDSIGSANASDNSVASASNISYRIDEVLFFWNR
jgi:hypothetical protein